MSVDRRGGAEDDVLEVGHEVEVERLRLRQRLGALRRRGGGRRRRRGTRKRRVEALVLQNATENRRREISNFRMRPCDRTVDGFD